jgi:hypothetical protein
MVALAACGEVATVAEAPAAHDADNGVDARSIWRDAHGLDVTTDTSVDRSADHSASGARDADVNRVDANTAEAKAPEAGRTCVTSCQSDRECQSTCPGGSLSCCDTPSGACFTSVASACPDAGLPPPTQCADPCTSDDECQTLCPPPIGTVMCCDTAVSACVPSVSCPAPVAQWCGGGTPGGLPCAWVVGPDSACASSCPAPPAGSSICCYAESGSCYESPTPTCPVSP